MKRKEYKEYEKEIQEIIEKGSYTSRSSNPVAMLERFAEDILEMVFKQDYTVQINDELLRALISFTKSNYIKEQHPKRYANAVKVIKEVQKLKGED